ncbi:DinB family protein [Paenibacillus albidus]|uniref:DinB family protein n=1 Tax=Paenibacillus albidus TaxID=2041023 RepID=UPI001BE69776|nr:DinB family protein [Paenibacillus albidus]MBT2290784.1 DinB family protein [Paenibacillus albidus]
MTAAQQAQRDHLLRLFTHVHWANNEILLALQGAEALPEKLVTLFGHLLSAEKVWLERLNGRDSSALNIWPLTRFEDCGQLVRDNHEGYLSFLSPLDDAGLNTAVSYRTSKGILFSTTILDILSHVALHGSYHRGQISSYLRLEGHEPVNTDYITFTRLESYEG